MTIEMQIVMYRKMIKEYELIIQRKLDNIEFKGRVYIYPFGKLGKVVAKILDQKGITYIPVDSFLDNVTRLENVELNEDDILLLSSNNTDLHTEMRMEISKRFSSGVIDLFEEDGVEFFQKQVERTQIQECNCIYELENYKVKMYLPLYENDYIQKWIFIHGAYFDEPNLKWLQKQMPQIKDGEQGIALDIGSNIGNHALFMAKEMGFKRLLHSNQ